MSRRILLRVCVGLVTLVAASAVVFIGTESLPGDAAQAALGNTATPQLLAQYRKDFNLDRPVMRRYLDWLSGLPKGNFGKSLPSGQSVASIVGDKIRNTAVLAGITMLILIPLSVALGTISAVRRDRLVDHGVTTVTLLLIATPEFVVGTLLALLLGVWLHVLPPVSLVDPERSIFAQPKVLILPVLTLLAAIAAQTTRMVRACMIDVLESEYVQMARLKGAPEWRVLLLHALPNAMGPTIQVLAMNVAWLAGGVVIVETVFQYPGIGLELTHAVGARDLATVEVLAVLITGVYVVGNLIADIAVMLLNPRLRRAQIQ
jgi:peptide/nickel transport system permease protein